MATHGSGLHHSEETRKLYKYPEKITTRGHTYTYLAAVYHSYSRAETVAKKLRKEGWGAVIHTTKVGLTNSVYGIYIRSKK